MYQVDRIIEAPASVAWRILIDTHERPLWALLSIAALREHLAPVTMLNMKAFQSIDISPSEFDQRFPTRWPSLDA